MLTTEVRKWEYVSSLPDNRTQIDISKPDFLEEFSPDCIFERFVAFYPSSRRCPQRTVGKVEMNE